MIKQRILLVMICCFFASSWAVAQRGQVKGMKSNMTEETKTTLNLSDEQRAELDGLQAQTAKALEAARQEGDRSAMNAAKQADQEGLEAILTADQLETLQSIRSGNKADRSLEMEGEERSRVRPEKGERSRVRPEGEERSRVRPEGEERTRVRPEGSERVRSERGDNTRNISPEDRASMKAEVESYRTKNIEPIMLSQRQKLDAVMSAEDRDRLATLRRELSAGNQRSGATENNEVVAMVNKYDAQISNLLREVSANKIQWKADQDAIRAKYMGQANEAANREGRVREGRPSEVADMNEKVRFLLRRSTPNRR